MITSIKKIIQIQQEEFFENVMNKGKFVQKTIS